MGESVRSVITAKGDELKAGDAIMLNSPYNGGTHLPDITVVTPWFAESAKPLFFLACTPCGHRRDYAGFHAFGEPSHR
jgi:5-oxoprolinase (ATP-hydrolysing)